MPLKYKKFWEFKVHYNSYKFLWGIKNSLTCYPANIYLLKVNNRNYCAPSRKKIIPFLCTKYFFDAASSCCCRHETLFCATSIFFFVDMKYFFVQHQHVFVDTKLLFVQCQTFCFNTKLFFVQHQIFFGHRLGCCVMVIYFYCHITTKNNQKLIKK